jgi:parvulin-like peptidyl-prolyl isomerase
LDERIDLRTLQNVAFKLKPGQASDFQATAEGGYVAHLKEKIPVSDLQVKAELPDFLTRLRAYRQNEAFNDWFRKEAEQARLTLPKSQTEVGTAR